MNRLAVAYYPEHVSETQWVRDLERMRAAGISLVRVFEFAWSRLQPGPDKFDLDWCERFISLARDYGIDVIVCTPTASAPPWLMHAYPETVMLKEGKKAPVGHRRNYCFSSPRYRELGRKIVQGMAERFRSHANVVGWQIDNELGFNFCQCSGCLDRYRAWLRHRYETVEKLNAAWGLIFWSAEAVDWDDIDFGMSHPEAKFAEKHFFSDLVVEFQNLFADQLHEAHPGALVTSNFMGNFEQVDYFQASKKLDVIGWDMYPELFTISGSAMAHDLMRCLKQRFHWTLENSTGCLGNWLHLDSRHFILVGIQAWAHGEQVHTLFAWRAFPFGAEQVMWGLVDQADRTTRIYDAAQTLAATYGKLPELTMEDFQAEVGFLYTYESFWAFQSLQGTPNYYFVVDEFYRGLQAYGLCIDVISSSADFSKYRVLVVPSVMTSDNALAAKLREYVAAGGHLVMGPQSFTRDCNMAWHRIPPPAGLTDVFAADVAEGCYTANYLGPDTSCLGNDAASVSAQPPTHERYPLKSKVPALDGAMAVIYASALKINGAEILASYGSGLFEGSAAITHHAFGSGSATLMGCSLEAEGLVAAYGEVLRRAGLTARRTASKAVEIINLKRHTIYLNHGAEPAREPAVSERALFGDIAENHIELGAYGFAIVEHI